MNAQSHAKLFDRCKGAIILCIVSIALLSGCATDPKYLVDFNAAADMSTEQARAEIEKVTGKDWANDPYVFIAATCAVFLGYDDNVKIKVTWEGLDFLYLPTDSNFIVTNHPAADSCAKGYGLKYFRVENEDDAKIIATALTALGAKPH